jgi:nucleotide-binding universal stress UspA family protein
MYKKLLVPIDGSSTAQRGLVEALRLAKQLQASIRIVHVVNEFIPETTIGIAPYYEDWVKALREGGRKVLGEAEKFASDQGVIVDAVLIETLGGRAADAVLDQAQEWSADLIVMGTHGRRGLKRVVMGSDAELVIREATVPVLLVRDPDAA